VNTQTGQRARDLPQEAGDPDVDLLVSRSNLGSTLAQGTEGPEGDQRASIQAGFGLPKRSGTPEPWMRKLADDGISYYFWNKHNGNTRWTPPEPEPNASRSAPFASTSTYASHRDTMTAPSGDSSASRPRARSRSASDRNSYSDDSDIDPAAHSASFSNSQTSLDGQLGFSQRQRQNGQNGHTTIELTSAERLAQALQRALVPPAPELVAELSDTVATAISGVVDNIQSVHFPRRPEENKAMSDLVDAAVLAVRNLLYVAAAPSGHIPTNVLPRGSRDAGPNNNASQALLKPAQRKVTATLSKVVLSARAMQFDSGAASSDTPIRIEADAEELERAVVAFVLEVQRSQNQGLVEELGRTGVKRLHGVFGTANIGLGLVGAGAAANWKGFGWVALDENDESSGKILGTEVINELATHLSLTEDTFNSLRKSLRSSVDESGGYHRALYII
jgi:son of sevenless-like protein